MTLFFILWLADFCANFQKLAVGLIILTIVLGIVAAFIIALCLDNGGDADGLKNATVKKLIKIWGITLAIIISISILLPSSKTIYIATGINAIQDATHSVAESDTAKKAIELLNIKLDEYINESKDTKK